MERVVDLLVYHYDKENCSFFDGGEKGRIIEMHQIKIMFWLAGHVFHALRLDKPKDGIGFQEHLCS